MENYIKIFIEELKKHLYSLFLVCLLFSITKLILPILKVISIFRSGIGKENLRDIAYKFLTVGYDLNRVVVIFLAIFMGIKIFSYLYNKQKVEYYNLLNMKREYLFLIKYFLGIFIVVPIILLSNILLYVIFFIITNGNMTDFISILKSNLFDVLFFISIYSITVFCCILAENKIIALLLILFFNYFIYYIIEIVIQIVDIFLENIVIYYFRDYNIDFNPIFCYFSLKYNNQKLFIIHSFIVFILFFINLILFKIRKVQNSKNCIVFKYAKSIIKYLVIFVYAFLFSFIPYYFINDIKIIYFGVIFWTIILHCIIECVYNFSIKGFLKNKKGILIALTINFLFISIYKFDLFKRFDYIPDINDVRGLSVVIDLMEEHEFRWGVHYVGKNPFEEDDMEMLKNILDLHKLSINTYKKGNFYIKDYFRVEYVLKNNRKIERWLPIYYSDDIDKKLKDIINTERYIKIKANILYSMPKFDLIIEDNAFNEYDLSKYEKEINKQIDRQLFLKTLRKDIEENGLYIYEKDKIFKLIFTDYEYGYDNPKTTILYVSDKYKHTLKYLENIEIVPKTININNVHNAVIYGEEEFTINNKEKIEKILNSYKIKDILSQEYQMPIKVNLNFKDGNYSFVNIDINLYLEIIK